MNPLRYLILILAVLSFTSCYYDSEEYLFPKSSNDCDTANVGYALSIQPLLSSYCYRCHDNNSAAALGNNIKLEDYADVKLRVDDGKLLGSIRHDAAYSPMPKGGGKLDNCSLEKFRIWIEAGAPEN